MAVATPVLLIIFNRPDTTARVWEAIRAAQPPVLLIAADAARNPEEDTQVQAARAITEQVDWPCTVHRRYASTNQGCKWGPYNAISWGFELVAAMIILEDDCLPHPDFFRFCDSMLERYRNHPQVMHISGSSFAAPAGTYSYQFSRFTFVWGWCTTRQAWSAMDIAMEQWPQLRQQGWLRRFFTDPHDVQYWQAQFDNVQHQQASIWDYQWTFSIWQAGGLCIYPAVNLVSNIGFGSGATHTHQEDSWLANRPLQALGTLVHPSDIRINQQADQWLMRHVYAPKPPSLWQRLLRKLQSPFNR